MASSITIINNAIDCVRAPVLNFLIDTVVKKTINNTEYWMENFKQSNNVSISGHYIENNYIYRFNSTQEELIEKWNWKTGWNSYQYRKIWDGLRVILEVEILSLNNDNAPKQVNIIFGCRILSVSTALIFFIKKFHKKS